MIRILETIFFRGRVLVLAIIALVTIVLGYEATKLRMDAGFYKQLPNEHEYVKTFFDYQDGRREPFAREKVLHGLALACRKRPIDAGQLEDMVRKVEIALEQSREPEVPSALVGAAVMQVLADTDEVAYVRFASVYREFESVDQFVDTIRGVMLARPARRKPT